MTDLNVVELEYKQAEYVLGNFEVIFISAEFVLEAVPAAESRFFAGTRRMPWSVLPESDLRPDVCVSSEEGGKERAG